MRQVPTYKTALRKGQTPATLLEVQKMKKIVVLVIVALLIVVPAWTQEMEALTVTISFCAIGLGIFTIQQGGWPVGVLQIVIGIGSLILVSSGMVGGQIY